MARDAEFRIAAEREFVDYVKWLSKEVKGMSSMSEYCRMAIVRQVRVDEKQLGKKVKRERGEG